MELHGGGGLVDEIIFLIERRLGGALFASLGEEGSSLKDEHRDQDHKVPS